LRRDARIGGAPLPPAATVCIGNQGVICAQDLTGFGLVRTGVVRHDVA
jgi:hypothetical protein